jgi:beta-lactam-binding protein with PASTA domain
MHLETSEQKPRREAVLAWVMDRDWVLALSLAFAVGVVVWFGRSVQDFFGPSASDVLVPALIGQTTTDAASEITGLKLSSVVVANQPSDRFPKDVVMGQQPAAGSRVRVGRQISIIVSTGVVIFPMPDLRYQSLREANLEMGRNKLALAKTTTVANDDVPANHVLVQDPPPLTSVREGTKVTLTLSKGPPSSVKVPNFVGSFIDDARDDATRAKIHLGQVVWTPFGPTGPPRGRVVRQLPAAGSDIDPFQPVSMQVSAGPTEYGYLIRQVHATATVPARDNAANVRMEVRDDTGRWNVYDGYAQGGQKLDFNLTVVGTAELDTYIDNELLSQVKLGVEAPRPSPSPGKGNDKAGKP